MIPGMPPAMLAKDMTDSTSGGRTTGVDNTVNPLTSTHPDTQSDQYSDIAAEVLKAELSEDQLNSLTDRVVSEAGLPELPQNQQELLRSTMEDMDESEVLGFLAMLESQSGWAPGETPVTAAEQTVPGNASAGVLTASAMTEVLGKALDGFVPPAPQESDAHQKLALAQNPGANAGSGRLSYLQDVSQSQSQMPVELVVKTQNSELVASSLQVHSADALSSEVATGQESAPRVVRLVSATPPLQNTAQSDPATLSRSAPVASEGWTEAMGQRLVTMLSEGRQEASMRLDPPDLGVLGVRLVVEDRGVSIQFNTAVPQVREMLEAQADKLRVALEQQGMNLVDVNVGHDFSDQNARDAHPGSVGGERFADSESDSPDWNGSGSTESTSRTPQGLVDFFA